MDLIREGKEGICLNALLRGISEESSSSPSPPPRRCTTAAAAIIIIVDDEDSISQFFRRYPLPLTEPVTRRKLEPLIERKAQDVLLISFIFREVGWRTSEYVIPLFLWKKRLPLWLHSLSARGVYGETSGAKSACLLIWPRRRQRKMEHLKLCAG